LRILAGVVIAAIFLVAMLYVTATETSVECVVCIRYGGGEVIVESVAQTVDPIEIREGRPTISYNEISFSLA